MFLRFIKSVQSFITVVKSFIKNICFFIKAFIKNVCYFIKEAKFFIKSISNFYKTMRKFYKSCFRCRNNKQKQTGFSVCFCNFLFVYRNGIFHISRNPIYCKAQPFCRIPNWNICSSYAIIYI